MRKLLVCTALIFMFAANAEVDNSEVPQSIPLEERGLLNKGGIKIVQGFVDTREPERNGKMAILCCRPCQRLPDPTEKPS